MKTDQIDVIMKPLKWQRTAATWSLLLSVFSYFPDFAPNSPQRRWIQHNGMYLWVFVRPLLTEHQAGHAPCNHTCLFSGDTLTEHGVNIKAMPAPQLSPDHESRARVQIRGGWGWTFWLTCLENISKSINHIYHNIYRPLRTDPSFLSHVSISQVES